MCDFLGGGTCGSGGVSTKYAYFQRISSDQQIRLCCDLNLNLHYESVDQCIQIHWITQNSW